jgi:hypothetical protein
MWDWHQLAGVSDYWSAADQIMTINEPESISAARSHEEGGGTLPDFDDYARLHGGWSGVIFSYIGDSYLEVTDDVADLTVTWVVRAKGDGTIHAYDDYDPDWNYSLPSNALTDIVVNKAVWVDYEIPSSAFTIDQLMSTDDGAQRFGMVIEGDHVDVDVVYLRIWPRTGVVGWWEIHDGGTRIQYPDIYDIFFGANPGASPDFRDWDIPESGGHDTGYWLNWVDMLDNAAADPKDEFVNSVNSGYGILSTGVHDTVVGSLGGIEHVGKFFYGANYLIVKTDINVTPNVTGTEGVDYIRRPDRHQNDYKEFFEYIDPTESTRIVSWINDNLHLVGSKHAYLPLFGWPGGDDVDGVTLNVWEDPDYVIPPFEGRPTEQNLPFATEGETLALADSDDGGTDTTFFIDLPLEPSFGLSFGNTGTHQLPPQSLLDGLSGDIGTVVNISAEGFLGTPEENLQAVVLIPDYRVWTPDGTRGGKLKHRLADSTWRTVGVDETGRLKFRSEDLTWWEEVKSTDADGPRQYLHFKTRWGWAYSIPFRPEGG